MRTLRSCLALVTLFSAPALAENTGPADRLAMGVGNFATPQDYGCAENGAADCSAATNKALAVSGAAGEQVNVYLRSGNYLWTGPITLAAGNCLVGDGRQNTVIHVTSAFNPSATGVINLANSNIVGQAIPGPCVKDLTIAFDQPPDTVVATTAAQVSGATIQVASAMGVVIGQYAFDVTNGGAIPNFTKVTGISGTTVTLSAKATGVANGDSIHFGPSRANFETLAQGCTTSAGGTGCKYPPAIYNLSSNRFRIDRVSFSAAWDGIINNPGNGTTIPPNNEGGFWISDVEMGALDVGLTVSGAQDVCHIRGYHAWNFGMSAPSQNGLFQTWLDGNTFATQFGECDGIDVADYVAVNTRTAIVAPTSVSGVGFSWGQFENAKFDGENATLEVGGMTGFLQILDPYFVGTSVGADTHNQIDVAGGFVHISNLNSISSDTSAINVTGGFVTVSGGRINPNTVSQSAITQSGGFLDLRGLYFYATAGTWTVPVVKTTSGCVVFQDNTFSDVSGSEEAFVAYGGCGANNVTNNSFGGWRAYADTNIAGAYWPNSFYQPPDAKRGTCDIVASAGNAGAGTLTVPSGGCAANSTIILTQLMHQPHGYKCSLDDWTTVADTIHQVSSAPTSATLRMAAGGDAGDTIAFKCDGY